MTRKDGRGLERPQDSEKITMISPTPAPWPLLLDPLLKERPTSGLAIHDLHLAATMLSNGVKKIYTFNTRHFARFSDIEAIVPPEPEPLPDAPSAEEPTV